MNTQPDFEDFFRLLESNGVESMVVGGYAVAFHGYPRFTKDIDVFFEASPANAARLRAALVAFGFQATTVQRSCQCLGHRSACRDARHLSRAR